MHLLNKEEILAGLKRLGELANLRHVDIKLLLAGGALMVIAFEERFSTKDVDAVILAPEETRAVRELATRVAAEYGWPEDWLNDGIKGYIKRLEPNAVVFTAPGIEVLRPDLAQVLGMKLSAWRDDVDISDAKRLLRELRTTENREQLWNRIESYLLHGQKLKARYAYLDLWEDTYGRD